MKIIPFAFVAMTLASAPAFAQSDACHNRYAQCVEHCGSQPPSMQETCSSNCENSANQCYSQMYGPSAQSGQVSVPSEAQDAHDEAPGKKVRH